MPDPFSTLPLPLPLMVLTAIEDLSTLNYLLQASPAANVIFEGYYSEITEAVMSNFVPELQQLLRTIVSMRSDRSSIKDTVDTPEALDSFLAARALSSNASAKPLSNTTVSLSAVRSLTSSASLVQQVSACFFEELLNRVNKIKPSYLLDQSYSYHSRYPRYPKKIPEGRPYKPLQCGHPSWIEEQRVLRALWRLEVYFDLVAITRPKTGSTSQVWNLLGNEGPHRIWPRLMRWETRELDCVYDYLYDISDATTRPPGQPLHLAKLPLIEHGSVTVPRSTPVHDVLVYNWCQSTIFLGKMSPAMKFLNTIGKLSFSPLYRSSFEPFQRLGFGIWDSEKMARLGLNQYSMRTLPADVSKMYRVGPFEGRPQQNDLLFRCNSLLVDGCKSNGEQ
ncbi:hypothetical protein IMSHALPRED_003484 [Imshaugia aleurites]|uniref:F-box domain-containing protein n=1 Tax=Imshaugia aleurites TaxID=172621 RepID=A0A8H3IKN4_9LECA|nr:hypothetical protein IMSHALPRED_003484 [Imshaugia aleurites]